MVLASEIVRTYTPWLHNAGQVIAGVRIVNPPISTECDPCPAAGVRCTNEPPYRGSGKVSSHRQ